MEWYCFGHYPIDQNRRRIGPNGQKKHAVSWISSSTAEDSVFKYWLNEAVAFGGLIVDELLPKFFRCQFYRRSERGKPDAVSS